RETGVAHHGRLVAPRPWAGALTNRVTVRADDRHATKKVAQDRSCAYPGATQPVVRQARRRLDAVVRPSHHSAVLVKHAKLLFPRAADIEQCVLPLLQVAEHL